MEENMSRRNLLKNVLVGSVAITSLRKLASANHNSNRPEKQWNPDIEEMRRHTIYLNTITKISQVIKGSNELISNMSRKDLNETIPLLNVYFMHKKN